MASIGNPQTITVQQAEGYAAQAGFNTTIVPKSAYAPGTYSQIQTIVGIAGAESGFNIHAYNPNDPYGGSFGILQINGAHFHAGGTSEQAALDPLKSFQYAYVLSNHGQNFLPWGTFTNKSYLQHIPNIGTQYTLPSNGWWTYPRVDNLGQPDSFGGFPKPDSNVQVPDNYPIATLLSGTVSGINNPNGQIDPWGAAVTIQLDSPLNSLATHMAYIHLASITVRMGQHVNVGDLIGYNGGNHAAGSQKVPLGVALYHGSYYGADGWQYMTQQNLLPGGSLNIVPLLDAAKSGNLQGGVGGGINITGGSSSDSASFIKTLRGMNVITTVVKPNDDLVIVLEVLDLLMRLINPLAGLTADPNPLDWIGELIYWTLLDINALIMRSLFLFLGFYLCFKAFNQLTNIGGAVKSGVQTGIQTTVDVAKLAALAG